MILTVGVLIIGSLYWEPDRDPWRATRFRKDQIIDVPVPIRYGRLSRKRGNTYTMVFSRGCPAGTAKIMRCQQDVSTPAALFEEAEQLWAAERMQQPDGSISATWGCVVLLPNPGRSIPNHIIDGWAERVSRTPHYGRIEQAPGEDVLVDDRGILRISWPVLAADNTALSLDLLLATANQPSLTGHPRSYPTPSIIADAWRNDRNDNVRYFRSNLREGITTFEDNAIRARLGI